MSRYVGLKGKPDKIVGGGKFVDENDFGAEVCNFLRCPDGYVYGFVETGKGDEGKGNWIDRKIGIKNLGAGPNEDYVDGITVVWTATNPDEHRRRIVGWYRNARVWRERQKFQKSPSKQHRADGLKEFHVRTEVGNEFLVSVDGRSEDKMPQPQHGKGWMGHTEWWFPQLHAARDPEIASFLRNITATIDDRSNGEDFEIKKIQSSKELNETEKKALLDARIGQGKFRKELLVEWGGCAVFGCKIPELLRASHIKPWKDADNYERLDRNNGLLLFAGLDAAFDCGLISFTDSGNIIISPTLSQSDRRILGISSATLLRIAPSDARKKYLDWHRNNKFRIK